MPTIDRSSSRRRLRNRKRAFDSGPWDEAALWLYGVDALKTKTEQRRRTDWHGAAGGYQVLRAESGHLVTRAPRYRHRPADADALHADVWWRGINVAMDAGTYSYNAPPPWDNSLAESACHNTVTVDGRDQMDRAGRFLWLPWLSGERTACATSAGGQLAYWEGTHDGYRRLSSPVRHRRGIVRIGEEHWLVIDAMASDQPHDYRLHWLLSDFPYDTAVDHHAVTLGTPKGDYRVAVACSRANGHLSLVRADEDSPRGWYAPHYADRQPALSLALDTSAAHVLFATLLGPQTGLLRIGKERIEATIDRLTCRVELATGDAAQKALPLTIELTGTFSDVLIL